MVGDGFPEVIDFCRLASGADVVEHFAHHAAALFVLDQCLNGMAPGAKGIVFPIGWSSFQGFAASEALTSSLSLRANTWRFA
jgi:hypothetical protein